MPHHTGKIIIFIGLSIVAIGLLWYLLGNKLEWLGRLPGDIRIERKNFRFYFPISTMVVLSLLASLIFNLLRRFL